MSQDFGSTRFVAENMNTELARFTLYTCAFAFTTTGGTVTINVPDQFRRYHVVGIVWAGTPASDEIASVPAPGTDGVIAATGSQGAYTVVITRTGASKTSGLQGCITLRAVP